MDAPTGSGFLTLVAAAGSFAFGGADAAAYAAGFVGSAGIVGEVGEG